MKKRGGLGGQRYHEGRKVVPPGGKKRPLTKIAKIMRLLGTKKKGGGKGVCTEKWGEREESWGGETGNRGFRPWGRAKYLGGGK